MMSVIQVEAFDLPLSRKGCVSVVIRDRHGRFFVDPLLMGMSYNEVLMEGMDEESYAPECRHDGVTFIDLKWLMPRYKSGRTVVSDECRNRKMASLVKRHCLDCAATLPARIVDVEFHEGG